MDDRRRALRRQMLGQPLDQIVHRRDRFGLRGAVLPAPARDLPPHVIARPAEIAKPDRRIIDLVQIGDDPVHRIKHRGAFRGARDLRQALVPEDAPVQMLHDIEGAADDRVVLAQRVDPRHRHRRLGQRAHDAELAVDRMRARQQGPRRFPPQHVLSRRGAQSVGRVRLPAGKALGADRPAEPRDMAPEPRLQPLNRKITRGVHAAILRDPCNIVPAVPPHRRPGEGRDPPFNISGAEKWVPAFAGTTDGWIDASFDCSLRSRSG